VKYSACALNIDSGIVAIKIVHAIQA